MAPYVSVLMLPARLEWTYLNGLHKNLKEVCGLQCQTREKEKLESQLECFGHSKCLYTMLKCFWLLHTEHIACWFHLSSSVLSHEQCHTHCSVSQMSLSLCSVSSNFSHFIVC